MDPLFLRLVRILAAQAIDEFLAPEQAPAEAEPERQEPAELPDLGRAA